MHNLKFKNFSLFKEETKINFSPITLLIGSNGSGKSSVLKLLNIIERNFEFSKVNKFDLGNISYQINDKRKPLEICVQISKNIFRKYKISIHKLDGHSLEDSYVSKNEFHLIYLNEENEVILETKPVTHGVQVLLYFNRLIRIIENEDIVSKLKMFYPLKNRIETNLIHPNFIDPKYFESWFWAQGFGSLLKDIIDQNESTNDYNKQLLDEILSHLSGLFKTKEFNDRNTNNFDSDDESRLLNLEIIRWNDLGHGKRIFTPEDSFGRTLKNLEYAMQPGSIHCTREFLSKWTQEFFGLGSKFHFKRIDSEFFYFVAKINGHLLTEQATGIYRILHLICKLSLMTFSPHWMNLFQKKSMSFAQKSFLVIEEPESNLHPDYQIKLAEMIFEFSQLTDRYVIIETHSEYMIRTFQYLVAKNENSDKQVGIINFGSEVNRGKVKHISIRPNGSLSDNFYSGFFNYSEDLRLMLDALNNQRNN
jgi:predicted ATP-dependent endonuclease of OLD family